jgi:cytochrome c oxidase assembly protein subunit 15
MFLIPLSRMTGGIYFEHAHRLFGALVGLTTLVMAVVLQRIEERPWVRRLGWGALVMVAVQGILGGVRVTGRLALGGSTGDASPSITLAVVHGVLAQVFLGTMVALAVFTSRTWRLRGPARVRASARIDRMLCTLLVGLLVTQIALGAAQRHLASGLLVHVAMAAAVTLVAVACGVRAWALNPSEPLLRFLGHAVIEVAVFQVLLGVLAYVVTVPFNWDSTPSPLRVAATTAHQWCGAVLLACAVLLAAWTHRLVRPSSTRAGGGNV